MYVHKWWKAPSQAQLNGKAITAVNSQLSWGLEVNSRREVGDCRVEGYSGTGYLKGRRLWDQTRLVSVTNNSSNTYSLNQITIIINITYTFCTSYCSWTAAVVLRGQKRIIRATVKRFRLRPKMWQIKIGCVRHWWQTGKPCVCRYVICYIKLNLLYDILWH